ncbi:hypothetical protein [Butyricicoccus intestinisimiae]|uniref:Uncharacterized protein n=1 Tax=Butyricicoccus intestinisimiae TaxID=2841509 RepID=A0ABS6ETC7_9FIRM|nr:hypothetical protein [Butyricicoccus intestinisimiae]MBU5490090.1 hypothetical protein [Butyricicoccus intestinisimiae]
MKKRQIVSIALCFVCAAIIGICCMAGISKWRAYQAEVKRQQQLAQYTEDLTDALNELYRIETDLFQDIAKQQASGIDNRTILQSMLDAATAPIDALAHVQAPDELADAQAHFKKAASSYHTMADTLNDMLSDASTTDTDLRDALIDMLPDAVSAFDEVKAGITVLSKNSDITLPDSAKQLETVLDSFSGDSLRSILTAQP